jgi:hypothetical protein
LAWSGHFYNITGNASSLQFLNPALWVTLVHPDVMAQCDGIDGVKDGIIEDPNLCDYDPSRLVCNGTQTTNCITEKQAQMIREVFLPFYIHGKLAFPRMQPGAEDLPIMYTGQPFVFPAVSQFRFFIIPSLLIRKLIYLSLSRNGFVMPFTMIPPTTLPHSVKKIGPLCKNSTSLTLPLGKGISLLSVNDTVNS